MGPLGIMTLNASQPKSKPVSAACAARVSPERRALTGAGRFAFGFRKVEVSWYDEGERLNKRTGTPVSE